MKFNPKLILFSFLITGSMGSFAQHYEDFLKLYSRLDSLMEYEHFDQAVALYDTLFDLYDMLLDREVYLYAAEANVMSGDFDRGYDMIEKLVFSDHGLYTDYGALMDNIYLMPLHGTERWNLILERLQENQELMVANADSKLKDELNVMLANYQSQRSYIDVFTDAYGQDSKEVQLLRDSMVYYDSVNQIRVIDFVNTNGIVSEKQVDRNGVLALFLVLNVTDTNCRKTFLPLVEDAFKDETIEPRTYARYVDILLLDRGFEQCYGTQVDFGNPDEEYGFLPIKDPELLDERRQEIGLPSIKRYARLIGINWDY